LAKANGNLNVRFRLDKPNHSIDLVDGTGKGYFFAVRADDLIVFPPVYFRYLLPRAALFLKRQSIFEYFQKGSPVRKYAENGKYLDDHKCRGENKIADLPPYREDNQHCQEKKERKHRDDHRPLQMDGRDTVDAYQFSEIF
jgi:hypothetical protein